MRLIDADIIINAQIYDDEHEDHFTETTTIADYLDRYTDEGCPDPVQQWIPIYDGDGQMPPLDDEGYSDYILLSFSNCNTPLIGQYRVDEDGGAFYAGDDDEPLTKFGLMVNAWMPLPKSYREEETC